MRYASTERVVMAWLPTLNGITASMVAASLPLNNNASWAASGFITPSGTGGNADIYLPLAHPIVTVKCWGVDPDSGLPPWNLAQNLAEIIRGGCLSQGTEQYLTLPDCDQNARLLSVYLRTEPRRMYGDIGDYACFTTDMALHWAVAP